MKKYLLLLVTATVMCDSFAQTLDAEQIYKKVNDAVVQVYAYGSNSKILTQGSGVVLNDKGWIVTNYHVYNGSDKLIVKHNDKIVEFTDVIGVDADKDILILKIADNTFPYVVIGNSDLLNVGQKIYAIGSPEGFENTITEGIISGLRSYEAHTQNYIQISAPISHGSSGGAVVNAKGELIGISALSSKEGQNLNFAIPVNEVLKVYKKGGVNKSDLSAADLFYKALSEDKADKNEQAIIDYKKAIAIDPNFVEAYYNLGVLYVENGNLDNAIFYFKKAIDVTPYSWIYYNLAFAYEKKEDYNAAILYYKKTVEIDPNCAKAYCNLAMAYQGKADYDNQIYYSKKAIALNPDDALAHYNLGVGYLGKNDLDPAITQFNKSIVLDTNLDGAYNCLGLAYEAKGERNLALLNFKKAIDINPNHATALYKFGLLTGLVNQDYNSAISYFKRAIANKPDYAQAYLALGTVYGILGDNYSSKLNKEKAYQLDPSLRK